MQYINPKPMQEPVHACQQLKPIQLISFDQDKKLILSAEAVEVFNRFTCSELYIVVVAGKYRTGKSYILNRVLLNRSAGFEVGHTINACTKGLWMWPELVTIKHQNSVKECLIVDTEGLGSLEEGENTDIKIFLMAILLSSYMIYNSVGNIDEKALESLSLVINLAEMLHKDNNQYDAQELINSFPSFMWLVRDFSLRLENEKGQQISSREYLQMALKYQKPTSNAVQRKNSIRKKLKTFFHERNCFTLIRPTENEKDLQNLSKLSERRLRPEFVTLIESFKNTLYSQLKPKKVRGKSVTPQGFIELCKYFVNTINSGKLPSINSHWDNMCVRQSTRIIDSYTSRYPNLLLESVRVSDDQQLAPDQKIRMILETHQKLLEDANNAIDKSFLGKLQKQLSKQRLHKCLTTIHESVLSELNEQRFAQVQEVVQEIFNEIVIEFTENKLESFEEIFARFEQIKQKYKHDARIYQSFYENSKDVFQQFLKNLKNQWEKEHSVLHEKNDRLENAIEEKTVQMRQRVQSTDLKMRQMEQQMYKMELNYQQSKQQINKLKQQLSIAIIDKQILQQSVNEYREKQKQTYQQQTQAIKNKLIHALNTQQLRNRSLEVESAKLEQVNKDLQIRQRKLVREMEIFKSKCSDYLKENIEISEELDRAKKKIFNFKKQNRKSTLSAKIDEGEESLVNLLNTQINELQVKLNLKEQELRNLNKILHDEIATNQTLLKSPHNLNHQSLKKNYEIEVKNNQSLTTKVKELENILILCSLKCLICKRSLNKKLVQSHSKVCASEKQITFDVSYQYNANGHLQFVIDVIVGEYEQQWVLRKSMKSIRLFLKKMENNISKMEKCQLFECKQQLKTFNEEDISQIERKRVYLNEMFHEHAESIWQNPFMIEFFSIDINFLNEHKGNYVTRDRNSMKNSQVSSQLSLNLDELQQNVDPLQNVGTTAQPNLQMKTCKFSKKTFNFGPHV